MKSKSAVKIMFFIIAVLMIFSAIPNNSTIIAAENKSSDYWNLSTSGDTSYYDDYVRTLKVETYLEGQKILGSTANPILLYDNSYYEYWFFGKHRESQTPVNPGDVTVNPKGSYSIDILELWNGDVREGVYNGTLYPNVTIEDDKTKTFKIYLVDKINNFYMLDANMEADSGNKNLKVITYVNGVNEDNIAFVEHYLYNNVKNPGKVAVSAKEGYSLHHLTLDDSPFINGTSVTLTGDKTLKVYLQTTPSNTIENNFWTILTENYEDKYEDRNLNIITYLDGTENDSIVDNQSVNFSINGPGIVNITTNEKYVIENMKLGLTEFHSGEEIQLEENKTLSIYLKTKTIQLYGNDYLTVETVNNQNDGTIGKKLNIRTYVNGRSDTNRLDVQSFLFENNGPGPGNIVFTAREGFNIYEIKYGNGNTFLNGSPIEIGNNKTRNINVYLNTSPLKFFENDYIAIETERFHDFYGDEPLTIETYINGDGEHEKLETQVINFDDDGPGKVSINPKEGFSIHHMTFRGNNFTNADSISRDGTLRIYLQTIPANEMENEYWTAVTENDQDNYDYDSTLYVETYLDGEYVNTITTNYNAWDGRYVGGPGKTIFTPNSGYVLDELQINGSYGSYYDFVNGSDISFNDRYTRTIKVYIETIKELNVNYYYDNRLDYDECISVVKEPGETVNIQGKTIDGYTLQKATISIDIAERSMNLETKDITLIMPDKSVTINYYYATEGNVIVDKTAAPIAEKNNEYEIEISVQGTPISSSKPADVILVFDKSGSMGYSLGHTTRMAVLKQAANKFIDSVLPKNEISLNQVAIVAYSGDDGWYDDKWDDAVILQPFTSANSQAKNSYKDLNPNGGTNNEAGFLKAKELFLNNNYGARDDVDRYVIYMTDGEPTFYYDSEGYTYGPGNSFSDTAKNNAIEEALMLKNESVKIYTVGLTPDDNDRIKQVLNPSGSNQYQEKYYHATTADELTEVYELLAAEINNTIANKAFLTDTLPYGFVFDTESLPDRVTIEPDGRLKWNLETITTNEKTLKFNVKYIENEYGIKHTNKSCEITYNHIETPDISTTKVIESPLAVIKPDVERYQYFITKGESVIVSPGDYIKINDAGDDYVVSNLRIGIKTYPQKGNVTINSEERTLTYDPHSSGYPEDSFDYTVAFDVTNSSGDPTNLCGTYESTVSFIVNPHPSRLLTISYFVRTGSANIPFEINGTTSINKILPKDGDVEEDVPSVKDYRLVDIQSNLNNFVRTGNVVTGVMPSKDAYINFYYDDEDYNLTINYIKEGGPTFDTYSAEIKSGSNYRVESPKLAGWSSITPVVEGTMPKHDLEVNVYYSRNQNKLLNNSKYTSKGLNPIGSGNTEFKIVEKFDNTFGFKFEAGQDAPTINIIKSDNVDKFVLSNFKLYETGNPYPIDTKDTFEALDKSKIDEGKTYIVTYNVKSNDPFSKLTVEIDMEHMSAADGVANPITIEVNEMPILE